MFGTKGPWVTRDPASLKPMEINLKDDMELDGKIIVPSGKCLLIDERLWEQGVNEAPFNRRGWVVEERLLSNSTLRFCSDRMFLECAELTACELFPNGLPEDIPARCPKGAVHPKAITDAHNALWEFDFTSSYSVTSHSSSSVASSEAANEDLEQRLREDFHPKSTWGMPASLSRWASIVEAYSGCMLTRPGDKLVAVAGLAKDVSHAIGCKYLAGLWRADLRSASIDMES